jgi:hypothetical protein
MFADDDRPHPEWEMNKALQRRLSIGIMLVIGAVIFLNLVATPDHDFWQIRQDRIVEFQAASIR